MSYETCPNCGQHHEGSACPPKSGESELSALLGRITSLEARMAQVEARPMRQTKQTCVACNGTGTRGMYHEPCEACNGKGY